MVLRSNVDFVGEHVLDRLVVPAISELELVGLASRSTREQLVAKANAEDGNLLRNGGLVTYPQIPPSPLLPASEQSTASAHLQCTDIIKNTQRA